MLVLAASAGAAPVLIRPTDMAVAPTITAILRMKLFIVSPPLVARGHAMALHQSPRTH